MVKCLGNLHFFSIHRNKSIEHAPRQLLTMHEESSPHFYARIHTVGDLVLKISTSIFSPFYLQWIQTDGTIWG